MITVQNTKILNALQNHEDKEQAYVLDEHTVYEYNAEQQCWLPLPKDKTEPQLTIYDLNKQIISQLPNLNEEGIEKAKEALMFYITETNNYCYMLIFKDISYYTVFLKTETAAPAIENEVIECLQYLGDVKLVEYYEEQNIIECWVKQENSELPIVGYLIAYDGGTILCS